MQNIQKQTYSDQIREYIKQSILEGKYRPGDKVNEVDIASRLKVSRAPVREALQHLTQSGLLVSIPQKGKFITSLTSKEIYDSYITGGILEGAAVAATIHLFTEKDFADMTEVVNQMAGKAEAMGGMHKVAELDNIFHDHLFSRSDNALLRSLSRRCCQGLSKFLLYHHWSKAFVAGEMYERHKTVLEAVMTRDPERIERAIRTHYQESGKRMSRYGSDIADVTSRDRIGAD